MITIILHSSDSMDLLVYEMHVGSFEASTMQANSVYRYVIYNYTSYVYLWS